MVSEDEPASKRLRLDEAAAVPGKDNEKPSDHGAAQKILLEEAAVPASSVDAGTLLLAMQQLMAMYKVEYWTLLEELRAKRHMLCMVSKEPALQGAAATANEEQAASAAAADSKGTLRQLMQAGAKPLDTTADDDVQLVAERKAPGEVDTADLQGDDAEAEQQPNELPYGDGRCGVGSATDGVLPSLSDVEGVLLQLPPGSDQGAADPQQLQAWHGRFKEAVTEVARLEQLASAATLQYLDAQGGLACLSGQAGRWVVRRSAVTLGRSTDSKGDVDIDLGKAGAAGHVSRLQAQLTLCSDGVWSIRNTGRAKLVVNGSKVPQNDQVALPHLSVLEAGGLPLLFMTNSLGMLRASARSTHLVM
eukprot:gene7147-7362_t